MNARKDVFAGKGSGIEGIGHVGRALFPAWASWEG